MKNLIRKILKEETNNDRYIVFVAGTNKTGISHQSQYDAFKNSVGETDKIIKYFNYDDHKGSNSELFTFLEDNMLNVEKLVLFSAGCTLANKLTPYYIPTQMTYCIEPWSSENGKKTWDKMYSDNFYVNDSSWKRGKGAMDGIPEDNKNSLYGKGAHTDALKDSTKKIFN
jgi:hypothetical protein